VIKALLKVSPPRVLFEGLSRRTVDYDSDQIARSLKFPALFVKPSAGINSPKWKSRCLNLAPEKYKTRSCGCRPTRVSRRGVFGARAVRCLRRVHARERQDLEEYKAAI